MRGTPEIARLLEQIKEIEQLDDVRTQAVIEKGTDLLEWVVQIGEFRDDIATFKEKMREVGRVAGKATAARGAAEPNEDPQPRAVTVDAAEKPAETPPTEMPSGPPPLEKSKDEWYYALDGERAGPVGEDELRELFASGVVDGETLLWKEGLEEWTRASDLGTKAPRVEWYYGLNNERIGPVNGDELRALFEDGTLDEDTLVWNKSMSQWTRALDAGLVEPKPTPEAVPDDLPPLPAPDSESVEAPIAKNDCAACGAPNQPDAKFCRSCGGALQAQVPTHCPSCSNELKPGAKFCSRCGHRM